MGQKTPSQFYELSTQMFPSRIPEIFYLNHFETRKVIDDCFYWKNQRHCITKSLIYVPGYTQTRVGRMFHGGFVGIQTRFKNIIFGTTLYSRIIQIYGS
ncbi:hypothetical protein [Leptospira borgpetersenii]|uniref:hypothetical protein n=2 Tax=Leptospira TaxID=171 RepID=UPI0020149FB5|nr:hypothetical protein [Leptospira borgpetersenii]